MDVGGVGRKWLTGIDLRTFDRHHDSAVTGSSGHRFRPRLAVCAC
jgi:hypothetical protein